MKTPLGVALEFDLDAQRTFLGRLLPYLSDHGARSESELEISGLSLFGLPFEPDEIADLLELARRHGLIEAVEEEDAYRTGRRLEWAATARGREVLPPTGLTLKDSRTYISRVTPLGTKLTGVAQAILGLLPLAALLKISNDDALGKGALVAGVVVTLLLLAVLYFGFQGDSRLRRAAAAWTRYRATWPVSYDWQVNLLRPWLGVVGLLLYFAPLLYFVSDRVGLPRGIAYAAFALGLLAIVYLVWRRMQGMKERRSRADEYSPREVRNVQVGEAHIDGEEFADKDLELLLRHVPNLHYDAQEGYRAVTAATMTAGPENRLAQAGDTLIAGAGSPNPLSLETLSAYPVPFAFQEGDHLASGKDPLGDAVRMQAEATIYPHATHGRVVRVGGGIWLEYWLWYYDNPKTFLGKGRHEGDWEMVIVELGTDEQPLSVICSQHNGGEVRSWDAAESTDGHPVVYVAPFSHANYFEARTVFYFPGADHPTATGAYLRPAVIPFGEWQNWPGIWGASHGVFGGRFNLGGTSPKAPIRQEPRWNRPDVFRKRGSVRGTVSPIFRLLWTLGKRTFPRAPLLPRAKIEDGHLTFDYQLRPDGLHFGRHLLLTAHRHDEVEAMIAREVLRSAPRRGRHRFELPAGTESCVLYASVFNGFGQRSDPVRAVPSAL